MSNVKRYHFDVRKVTKPETVKGGAIEPRTYFEVFTKVRDGREEAEELATKLADYERLRDALEKLKDCTGWIDVGSETLGVGQFVREVLNQPPEKTKRKFETN